MTKRAADHRVARWIGWRPIRAVRRALVIGVYHPLLRIWLSNFVVTGREHIPAGAVIFAAQHTSMADTPLLLIALGQQVERVVVTAARDYFFRRSRPGFGTLIGIAFGAIPIDRTGFARRSLRDASAWLSAGFSVVIYPHGAIPEDAASAQQLRRGVALLARQSGCPVVPVRFIGAAQLLPSGVHWPRRAVVEVTFLPPFDVVAEPHSAALMEWLTESLL